MNWSAISTLLLFVCSVFGLVDYYSLENNKVLQSCAYVSTSNGIVQNWFKKYASDITIHIPAIESDNEEINQIDVYTLLMAGSDMNNVQIGLNPYYKICDEIALDAGYCNHESDDLHLKKMTLSALIDTNSFKYPIESFMIMSGSNDHIYNIENSGIYCAMILTSNLPDSIDKLLIEVDWHQAYGQLLVSDFIRMFTSIIFSILYAISGTILSILIYLKLQNDGKTSITLDTLKYKKYTLQYKFILFFWSYSFVYLTISINYITLNKFGYTTDSILVPLTNLFYLVSSTIVTVWMIYHFLIISAGAWFNGFKNSSSKLYIARSLSAGLLLQMLVYDLETSSVYSLIGSGPSDILSTCIYIEYIIIYFICIYWSFLTSFNINEKKIKSLFFTTIALLTLSFGIIIFGAYSFSSTAKSSAGIYLFEFIAATGIAALWYNVVIDNNQMTRL